MDLGLRGRVYVVTGGTRGLGFATAQQLVAEGARVVVSSRDAASGAAAVKRLQSWGRADSAPPADRGAAGGAAAGPAVAVAADNADPATPGRLVETARERFGRLDGGLISVGGPPAGSVADTPDETWRSAFESVFLGAVRVARVLSADLVRAGGAAGQGTGPAPQASDPPAGGDGPAAPSAAPTGVESVPGTGGSILFVLSSSVRIPIARLAISNGLRPGLAGVVKTLAEELGPEGVRVNGVLPGRIDTDRVRELDRQRGDPEQIRHHYSRQIPLGRYGEPEEFGRAAAFLLSPAASYITGAMVTVDGGLIRAI